MVCCDCCTYMYVHDIVHNIIVEYIHLMQCVWQLIQIKLYSVTYETNHNHNILTEQFFLGLTLSYNVPKCYMQLIRSLIPRPTSNLLHLHVCSSPQMTLLDSQLVSFVSTLLRTPPFLSKWSWFVPTKSIIHVWLGI